MTLPTNQLKINVVAILPPILIHLTLTLIAKHFDLFAFK